MHYAKEFERLYRKEFDETDKEGRRRGPEYDYLFKMNPAWKSSDGKYVTYRFYTFNYTMGMHGLMNEYYLTFDNTTGRILGAEELFKTDKYEMGSFVEGVIHFLIPYNEIQQFLTIKR